MFMVLCLSVKLNKNAYTTFKSYPRKRFVQSIHYFVKILVKKWQIEGAIEMDKEIDTFSARRFPCFSSRFRAEPKKSAVYEAAICQ